MIYQNARMLGRDQLVDIKVESGIITEIGNNLKGSQAVDLQGKIVSSPFVEPHIHLDTTLTAGEPNYNISGTLFEGIEIWNKRKQAVITFPRPFPCRQPSPYLHPAIALHTPCQVSRPHSPLP